MKCKEGCRLATIAIMQNEYADRCAKGTDHLAGSVRVAAAITDYDLAVYGFIHTTRREPCGCRFKEEGLAFQALTGFKLALEKHRKITSLWISEEQPQPHWRDHLAAEACLKPSINELS